MLSVRPQARRPSSRHEHTGIPVPVISSLHTDVPRSSVIVIVTTLVPLKVITIVDVNEVASPRMPDSVMFTVMDPDFG